MSTYGRGFKKKKKKRFLPWIDPASSVVDDPIPHHRQGYSAFSFSEILFHM
jgi:hypothetical protein